MTAAAELPQLPRRKPLGAISAEGGPFASYTLAELLVTTEAAIANMRQMLAMARAAALDDDRDLLATYAGGAEDQALIVSAVTREIATRLQGAITPTKETL